MLIKEIITSLGHNCKEADNGKKAIDIINEEVPHIIFMDIEMPVMNGFETTHYIRDELLLGKDKLPVIALTAHDPALFEEEFKENPFNDVATKPYNPLIFEDLINKHFSL